MDNQKQNTNKNKNEKDQYLNKTNVPEVKNTKNKVKETKHPQENDTQ